MTAPTSNEKLADIVERLRALTHGMSHRGGEERHRDLLILEAAAEIERLRTVSPAPEALSVEAVERTLCDHGFTSRKRPLKSECDNECGNGCDSGDVKKVARAVLALLSSTRQEPGPQVQDAEARGFARAIEAAAKCADQWGKSQELLLRCGEMKAQELRTAVAVANGIARAVRALAQAPASHLSAKTEEMAS